MLKKIGIIIKNFIITLRLTEVIFLFVIPIAITFLIYLFSNEAIFKTNNFIKDFINTTITITALLSSFGLASLSILASSSSRNIEVAKSTYTMRRKINGKGVTYYKLQVIRNFFGLLVQFIVLILSIIFNFVNITTSKIQLYFYIITFLLLVSIFSQIFIVTSIYYLFVTPKEK